MLDIMCKKRGSECSVKLLPCKDNTWRNETMLSILLFFVTRQHIPRLFVPVCWLGCVLTAGEVCMEVTRDHLLLCSASECDFCVHIFPKEPSRRGNAPLVPKHRLQISPGVRAASVALLFADLEVRHTSTRNPNSMQRMRSRTNFEYHLPVHLLRNFFLPLSSGKPE